MAPVLLLASILAAFTLSAQAGDTGGAPRLGTPPSMLVARAMLNEAPLAQALPGSLGAGGIPSAQPGAAGATADSAGPPSPKAAGGAAPLNSSLAGYPSFNVGYEPDRLPAQITSRPGTYPVGQKLRVTVDSELGGWRLGLKATFLTLKESQKIDPDEVRWRAPSGEWLPLHQFQDVVINGAPGRTVRELEFALITGKVHEPGDYEGWLDLVWQHPQGEQSPLIKVPFGVAVNCQVDLSMAGNKVYFHVGNPMQSDAKMDALIEGHIQADAATWLQIEAAAAGGRYDQLPLAKPAGNTTPKPCTAIPMEWKLGEGGGGSMRKPDSTGGHDSQASWLLRGTPGETDFRIQCGLRPENSQSPGDYGMQLLVTLAPTL
ncbi:MAG: hypothetical protein NTW86_25445 [Candidatus Sumerlaeota bacterium]|nr:hypothetical protein [Candidatus Sumerlaeota bacterium]